MCMNCWDGTPPFWHPLRQKAFILDWDGVLAETELDFQPIFERYFSGKRVMLLETLPLLGEEKRRRVAGDLLELEMEGARRASAVPGAFDFIALLEERGIPWAVVSRNCEKAVRVAAESISFDLPDYTFTRDQEPIKPDPRALWRAAECLGAEPRECVMVGDFLYDLMGARRAGMRSVLVQRREPSWLPWTDLAFEKLEGFVALLRKEEPLHPREYEHISEPGELQSRWNQVLSLPPGASEPGRIAFEAALWGCGFLEVPPEELLQPPQWSAWHGLSSFFLGKPLVEAVRESLQRRFPLLTIREGVGAGKTLPLRAEALPSFLAALEEECR